MAGYDTAGLIYDSDVQSGVKQFGTPDFFIRYFNPCPYQSFNSSSDNANAEARAAWDDGAHSIGPISSPASVSGSSAEGHADAQAFGASLQTAYLDVAPLDLPSNGILYCWLDDEAGETLSSSYFDAWAGEIDGWNWFRAGAYPLYAGLYCNPDQPPQTCSVASGVASAIWSSVPICVGGTVKDPPAWRPRTCAGNFPSTVLWQFADSHIPQCYYGPDVDMDVGAPGFNYGSYTFVLAYRP